jgi:hypothetical protein
VTRFAIALKWRMLLLNRPPPSLPMSSFFGVELAELLPSVVAGFAEPFAASAVRGHATGR